MNKEKRILHIIGRMDRAGAETMLMNLYKKLDRNKFQFDFLYFTEDECHYDDEIIRMGGKIYRLPISKFKNPILRTYALYKFLKNNNFYAIHSHTLFSNGLNLLAAKLAGHKNRISHSHNTNDVNSLSVKGKLYQKFSKFLINTFATIFVACGKEAANYLYYNSKETIFLPNAVNVDAFNNAVFNDFLRKEYNIDKEKIIIIQVGRFSKVKNYDFTISIAEQLKNKKFQFHIFLVGDGVMKNEIKKIILEKKLQNDITLLGIRSDIPELLKNSDILLMPSLYEGFPVVLVESQASGLPALISTNISKEVDIGVNKIFFLPLSKINEWVDTIINYDKLPIINEHERLKILKQKGFDINESIKILYKIYE